MMIRMALFSGILLMSACSGMPREIDPPWTEGDAGPDVWVEPEVIPGCEAEEELCDGLDNDCDDEVDEDIPPEPCPEGGASRCVMGRWSECPLEVTTACSPGSVRQCFDAYCTGWGVQVCNSSGSAFETCQEAAVPRNCEDEWGWAPHQLSTGECCIAEGFCCQDSWDIDGDGDFNDSVGTCYGIDNRP